MKNGVITFAGAGPGAIDLMTVRCRNAIAAADVIVYAGSLVNPDTLQFAKKDCKIYDSAGMNLDETTTVLVEAARAGLKPLRLHTGDPALYGAIAEQMRLLDEYGVEYDVIPGVTAMFAAAAAVKAELTVPGVSQSIIIGRRAGRTPVPHGQEIPALAKPQATMALYLSVADMDGLIAELYEGGYPAETAAAVVYRATWPDEKIVRGTLADIATKVREAGIGRQACILVGDTLKGRGDKSLLYAPSFSHGYRVAHPEVAGALPKPTTAAADAFNGRVAVYALTETGSRLAGDVAKKMNADAFLSQKFGDPEQGELFAPETFGALVSANWATYDAHVFVMATGIVIRKIAPLLQTKTTDPAVLVCDELGQNVISLLSGHIGGANRLTEKVASVLGGRAIITTATDVQGMTAFDDLALRYHWDILNPKAIKDLNSLLLERKPVGLIAPKWVKEDSYKSRDTVELIEQTDPIPAHIMGLVALAHADLSLVETDLPILWLKPKKVALGIGCNRGTSAREIQAAVASVLTANHLDLSQVRGVASIDLKSDEAGLLEFASANKVPIAFFPAHELDAVKVNSTSAIVKRATGTGSVSEAAALLMGGGTLIIPKQKCGGVTVAVSLFNGE